MNAIESNQAIQDFARERIERAAEMQKMAMELAALRNAVVPSGARRLSDWAVRLVQTPGAGGCRCGGAMTTRMKKEDNILRAVLVQLKRGRAYGDQLNSMLLAMGVKSEPVVLFPALREMEQRGLLNSYTGRADPAQGWRSRRYYTLTVAGMKAAERITT